MPTPPESPTPPSIASPRCAATHGPKVAFKASEVVKPHWQGGGDYRCVEILCLLRSLIMSRRFAANTGDELSVRCEYEWQAVGPLGMPVARAIGGYRSNRRGKRIRRLLQEKGTEMSTRP